MLQFEMAVHSRNYSNHFDLTDCRIVRVASLILDNNVLEHYDLFKSAQSKISILSLIISSLQFPQSWANSCPFCRFM